MPKALLINPNLCQITAVEITRDARGSTLESIYSLLRSADPAFSGTIDSVDLGANVSLYVDDEGAMEPGRSVFHIGNGPICGSALVVSHDEEGDITDLRLPASPDAPTITGFEPTERLIPSLSRYVQWTDLETTGDFEPSREALTDHPILGPNTPTFIGGAPIFRTKQTDPDIMPDVDGRPLG